MKFWKQIGSIAMVIAMLLSLNVSVSAADPTIGSITIHKYKVDSLTDYSLIGDGTLLDPGTEVAPGQTLADLQPLAGIKFKITAVQLKTAATSGSTVVSDYEPIPSGMGDFTDTKTTDTYGIITWDDLALGLYLIEELSSATVNIAIIPFIIQLPLTNPAGNGFLYDVHVYPKNEVTGPKIDKTLVPPAAETGTNILKWKISSEIPVDIMDAKNMVITDPLDSRFDYVTGSVSAYYVDRDGIRTAFHSAYYTMSYTNNVLTFTILPAGFTTLDLATAGIGATAPMVFFEFDTMIKMDTNPNWNEAINTPVLDFTNADNYAYDPKEPIISPSTYLHGIEIFKSDPEGNGLEGAKFKIYPTQADANAKTNALKDPVNPANDWEIITDTVGKAPFNGLSHGTFWLVETQAPAGYNLLAAPVIVVIPDDSTAIIVQEIANNRGFTLPVTGGTGTLFFTIGGLLLIAVAIVFFIFSKRKKSKNYMDNKTR